MEIEVYLNLDTLLLCMLKFMWHTVSLPGTHSIQSQYIHISLQVEKTTIVKLFFFKQNTHELDSVKLK